VATPEELKRFAYRMAVNGAYLCERIVPEDLCVTMKENILELYEKTIRPYQIRAGLGSISQWSAHHICGRKDGVHDFLERDDFHDYVTAYFDGKPCILNSVGAAINPPVTLEGS
jgi:hypothetical protein